MGWGLIEASLILRQVILLLTLYILYNIFEVNQMYYITMVVRFILGGDLRIFNRGSLLYYFTPNHNNLF
jgi:hypothetical protein